jgi:hypothetical protein
MDFRDSLFPTGIPLSATAVLPSKVVKQPLTAQSEVKD